MTSSHYQHAYLLNVYHQPTRSRATTGLGWLHILAEEEPSPLHGDVRSTIPRRSAGATALLPLYVRPHSHPWTQSQNHSADGSAPARQEVLTLPPTRTSTRRDELFVLYDGKTDRGVCVIGFWYWNHFDRVLVDPDFPRTSNTVEGFHRGFKTRVNRRTPSFRSMSEQSRESRSWQIISWTSWVLVKRREGGRVTLTCMTSVPSTRHTRSEIECVFAAAKYFYQIIFHWPINHF